VTKNFLKNKAACRELFFSDDLPQAELDRCQRLLRENASPVPVIEVCAPLQPAATSVFMMGTSHPHAGLWVVLS
jgi:hypothetical protein